MSDQLPGGLKPPPAARVVRVPFRVARYYWQAPNPPERDFGIEDDVLVETTATSYIAGWTFLRRTALRNIDAVMAQHEEPT